MHPEAYARSRSVKAHRSPPLKAERRKSPADARPKHSPAAREVSRKDSRSRHADRPERQRESKEEATQRIWQQVQARMTGMRQETG